MKGFNIKGISLFIIVCMIAIMGIIVLFLFNRASEPEESDTKETSVQAIFKRTSDMKAKKILGQIRYDKVAITYTVRNMDNGNTKIELTQVKDGENSKTLEYIQIDNKGYVYLEGEDKPILIEATELNESKLSFLEIASLTADETVIQDENGIYSWTITRQELLNILNDKLKSLIAEAGEDFSSLVEGYLKGLIKDVPIQIEVEEADGQTKFKLKAESNTGQILVEEVTQPETEDLQLQPENIEKAIPLKDYFFVQ